MTKPTKTLLELDPAILAYEDFEGIASQPFVEDFKSATHQFDRAQALAGQGEGLRQAIYALEELTPLLQSSKPIERLHTILYKYRRRILKFIDNNYGTDFLKA